MKFHRFGTLAVLVAIPLGAAAPAAAAPAVVKLRVEGSRSTIFEGPVQTDAKRIGGHPCNGTNNGANARPGPTMTAALDDASRLHGFSWKGSWNSGFSDFQIDRIGPDSGNASTNQFWGYAYNWHATSVGGCQQKVRNRGNVLFAYDFFSKHHLLQLNGPSVAKPGQPVQVKVVDGQDGSPISGATVDGTATGAQGTATVIFASAGVHRLKAERADSVRSNALDVCVYTSAPAECRPTVAVRGIRKGERFSHRRGPRKLSGTASAVRGLFQVSFRLTRRTAAGCQSYSVKRRAFSKPRRRCGGGFQALRPTRGWPLERSWSYLLGSRLPKGRYTLEEKALDRALNAARTRVRFTVLP